MQTDSLIPFWLPYLIDFLWWDFEVSFELPCFKPIKTGRDERLAIIAMSAALLCSLKWFELQTDPFCLAAWEIPITRFSKMLKENVIFQGRVICSAIYILVKKKVASFLDLKFLFSAMHSWLHEHKQMWNHILSDATLRKWNKFSRQSENISLSLSEGQDNMSPCAQVLLA